MNLRRLVSCLAVFFGLAVVATAAVPPEAYSALRWRLVGPLRGGWATSAVGVPGKPDTFYIGTADGGVWTTTDAGRTWNSLFDHEGAASVGALALAPSDPAVLYVGTGQVSSRWDITSGNGVYRSGDGGKTWSKPRHFETDPGWAFSNPGGYFTSKGTLFLNYWACKYNEKGYMSNFPIDLKGAIVDVKWLYE